MALGGVALLPGAGAPVHGPVAAGLVGHGRLRDRGRRPASTGRAYGAGSASVRHPASRRDPPPARSGPHAWRACRPACSSSTHAAHARTRTGRFGAGASSGGEGSLGGFPRGGNQPGAPRVSGVSTPKETRHACVLRPTHALLTAALVAALALPAAPGPGSASPEARRPTASTDAERDVAGHPQRPRHLRGALALAAAAARHLRPGDDRARRGTDRRPAPRSRRPDRRDDGARGRATRPGRARRGPVRRPARPARPRPDDRHRSPDHAAPQRAAGRRPGRSPGRTTW